MDEKGTQTICKALPAAINYPNYPSTRLDNPLNRHREKTRARLQKQSSHRCQIPSQTKGKKAKQHFQQPCTTQQQAGCQSLQRTAKDKQPGLVTKGESTVFKIGQLIQRTP